MEVLQVAIDDKLKQDEERLAELEANLDKSRQLTDNMVVILESFTGRLKKLDETIQPVYSQTLRLTRLQENVDKTLTQMEKVIGFHCIADQVEGSIREGPSGDIDGYLSILNKLKVALDFFSQNNPESLELGHVSELFETGLETLSREFLRLLRKFSKIVPIATLHDVAANEDSEDIPPIELLPVRVVSDLKAIAEYLVHAPGEGHTDVMNVYSQLRSNTLGRTLNSIKEINQGGQNLLGASIPKKTSFPFLPTRRGTVRKGQQAPSAPSNVEPSASGESVVDEKLEGCNTFLMSSTVFLRLIQSESRLMSQVIPHSHHSSVLDQLTKIPINYFMTDGEALHAQARRSIGRHEYAIVLSCLRLIKHIHCLMPEYTAVLEGLKSQPFERFPLLLQRFEKLVATTLSEQYISFIKGDSEKQSNLSKDGTVHELTSSTLWFVEHLLEYSRILGEIILGKSSFSVKSTDQERKNALGKFLVQVFNALNLNLENKARSYESPFLAAIFLLNNFHFMHKTFNRNTHMLGLLEAVYDGIDSHYIGLITQQGRAYQRGFTKLITFLGLEVTLQGAVSGEKLNKQRRQLLKDKFKGFNLEFEELHRVQEQWSIPDPQLRSRVRTDNVDMIVSLYKEFYRMYGSLNFTKNPEKYVKYEPDTLELHLNSFFDGGAS